MYYTHVYNIIIYVIIYGRIYLGIIEVYLGIIVYRRVMPDQRLSHLAYAIPPNSVVSRNPVPTAAAALV